MAAEGGCGGDGGGDVMVGRQRQRQSAKAGRGGEVRHSEETGGTRANDDGQGGHRRWQT